MPRQNRPMSPENRLKLSQTLKERGIKPSPEARAKGIAASRAKAAAAPKLEKPQCKIQGCGVISECRGYCKPCYDRERRKDPAIIAKRIQRQKEQVEKDPSFHRKNNIKRYGIDCDTYEAILIMQDGLCAICGLPPSGKNQQSILHIDHCHTTGEIRGLLCHGCNTGIGGLKHNITILGNAKSYLNLHGIFEESDSDEAAF